jgi:hypothetical protein
MTLPAFRGRPANPSFASRSHVGIAASRVRLQLCEMAKSRGYALEQDTPTKLVFVHGPLGKRRSCAGKLACKIRNSQIRLLASSQELGSRRVRVGARAIVLASHLLNSLVRNSEIRRERLFPSIPTKMPTKRTAAANFYMCFQCAAKIFLKIRNRTNTVSYRYCLCFKSGALADNRHHN